MWYIKTLSKINQRRKQNRIILLDNRNYKCYTYLNFIVIIVKDYDEKSKLRKSSKRVRDSASLIRNIVLKDISELYI
jgi:hypothetical protein